MRSSWLPDMDWVGDRRAVDVAVVGDQLHGKTTLAASLVLAQHERLGVPLPAPLDYLDPIHLALRGDYSPPSCGTSVPTATARRVLNLIDCPGGPAALIDAIRLVGMADGVVLVVSAEFGVTTHSRNMAYAASRAGVRHLVGFVNLRAEPDPASRWWKEGSSAKTTEAQADAAELEFRRLLLDAGYPGDDVTVIRGETWKNLRVHRSSPPEWVDRLLYAIETEIPTPPRDDEAPLLVLASGDKFLRGTNSGFDYAVEGVVRRGVLRAGAAVEFIGGGVARRVAHVHTIRRGGRTTNEAMPGDLVTAIFLTGGPFGATAVPCHALAEPGTCVVARKLVARLTALTEAQGGRRRGIPSGMCPRFSMGTAAFRARVVVDRPNAVLKPGETGRVEIETAEFGYHHGPKGFLFEPGRGFVCRDGGRVIAVGEVEAMAG